MSDYGVYFEVNPGLFEKAKVVVEACCFKVFSEPSESQEIRTPPLLLEEIHFSVIKEIESSSHERLKFTTCDDKVKTFMAIEGHEEHIMQLIKLVTKALASVYPMVPLERLFANLDLRPAERFENLRCEHSAAICDTLFAADDSQDAGCLTFSLSDFHMRCSVENVELLCALQHNTWFKYFNADGTKMTSNEVRYIGKILRTNVTLESIDLSNTGLLPESLQEIAFALIVNSASKIVDVNLSYNQLGQQGISTLSAALLKLPRGLRNLSLEETGLTIKFASQYLFNALFSNAQHASTLQCLELGGFARASRRTTWQPGTIENILIFLAIPNSLQELDMSDGGIDLVKVIGSLQRGCLQNLKVLNMSGNEYAAHGSEDPPEYWKRFFMNAFSLETICLSRTMLSASAFRNLLIGLSYNEKIAESSHGISLDVSHNNLGKQGADILITIAPDLKNIRFLDVTNNILERELTKIFESLQRNQSIRHLSVGQNFSFSKQRQRDEALSSLISLMQSEQSVLESIDVSNSNLGSDTLKVIAGLENNTKIKKIDLRGNNMGDVGAVQLAKVLHSNATVTWLSFDCNNITAKGLGAIAKVLKGNPVNREVAMPTMDIARAVKKDSVKANRLANTFVMATFVHHKASESVLMRRRRQSDTKSQQQRSSNEATCTRISKDLSRSEFSASQPNLDKNQSSLAVEDTLTPNAVEQAVNEMPRQALSAQESTKRESTESEVFHRLSRIDISGGATAPTGKNDNDPGSLVSNEGTTSNDGSQDAHRERDTVVHTYLEEVQDACSTSL